MTDTPERKEITVSPLRIRFYTKEKEPNKAVNAAVYGYVKGRFPADRVGEVEVRFTDTSTYEGDVDVDRDGTTVLQAKWTGYQFIIRT